MNNYYATYQNIGKSDIAVFKSKEKRDEWVSFKDPISKTLDANQNNATFQRMALNSTEAEHQINHGQPFSHIKDEFDSDVEWYIFSDLT